MTLAIVTQTRIFGIDVGMPDMVLLTAFMVASVIVIASWKR